MRKRSIAVNLLVLSLVLTGCIFQPSAKGENVKVDYTGTASVAIYPVCPNCNHVSPIRYVNVSDGEYARGTHVCESCYEVYEITVDRR